MSDVAREFLRAAGREPTEPAADRGPADRLVQVSLHLRPDQRAALSLRHKQTRVPVAVQIREAIDEYLTGREAKRSALAGGGG